MIEIRPLFPPAHEDFKRLITGYISDARYQVSRIESPEEFVLRLELSRLPQPYSKRYDHLDTETLNSYQRIAGLGFSFGAYQDGVCVGLALVEPQRWNRSLLVLEFHVAEEHRGKGAGKGLIDALVLKGESSGFRTLVCETQNTNVPAIRFYKNMGFTIEGIDLSYYTNSDFPDGEVALFLKKRLADPSPG